VCVFGVIELYRAVTKGLQLVCKGDGEVIKILYPLIISIFAYYLM
jgi:hypothetical protein